MQTYTIEQFLAAAKNVKANEIAVNIIIEELVKMNTEYRKIIKDGLHFKKDDIVKVVEFDQYDTSMNYRCIDKNGVNSWVFNNEHEPTTETF